MALVFTCWHTGKAWLVFCLCGDSHSTARGLQLPFRGTLNSSQAYPTHKVTQEKCLTNSVRQPIFHTND